MKPCAWAVLLICCGWAAGAGAAERPATGVLIYPQRFNVDPQEGTLEFWWKPRFDTRAGLPLEKGQMQGLASLVTFSGQTGGFSSSYLIGSIFGGNGGGTYFRFSPQSALLPLTSAGLVEQDQWEHLALVWRGHETLLYRNGELVSQRRHPGRFADSVGTQAGKPLLPKWPFYFGDHWNRGGNFVLDDIRLSAIARRPEDLGFHQPGLTPDPFTILLDACDQLQATAGEAAPQWRTVPQVQWEGDGGLLLGPGTVVADGRSGAGLQLVGALPAPTESAAIAPAMEQSTELAWPRALHLPLSRSAPLTPTIDGEVDRREWFAATSVTGFVDEATGRLGDLSSTVHLALAGPRLLAAFVFERPAQNRQPDPADALVLRFQSRTDAQTAVEVQLTSAGQLTSTFGQAARIEHAVRVTDQGWEGELALPLELLGITTTQPGDTWRLNCSRVDHSPQVVVTRLSPLGRFAPALEQDAVVQLVDVPLALHLTRGWQPRPSAVGATLRVSNFGSAPLALLARGQVGSAAALQTVGVANLLADELTDDLGQPRGQEATAIAQLLTHYPAQQRLAQTLTLPPRHSALLRAVCDDAPGDYAITAALDLQSDAAAPLPLLRTVAGCRVPDHLGLQVQAYLLTGALAWTVDLRRLAGSIDEQTTLTMTLLRASEPLGQQTIGQLNAAAPVDGAFRIPLEPGTTYAVQAELRQGEQTLAQRQMPVATPAAAQLPAWWTAAPTTQPLIPEPWTPIALQGSTVNVLGRTYELSAQGLPARIVNRGREQLAAPIELLGPTAWQVQQQQCVRLDDEAVQSTSVLRAGEATLTVRNRIEFDGFMLIDLELTGRGDFDRLELRVPLRAELATLMQNYRVAPGPGGDDQRVPRYAGTVPTEGYVAPPFITQWIGNDHLGLEFSCESTRGWAMAQPAQALRVERTGDAVALRLLMINQPITLDPQRPRRIRFALVATPTKTLLPWLRQLRFYDDVNVALLPKDWSGHPAWHPPVTDPQQIARLKVWVDENHQRGQKLLVNGGWAVSLTDAANSLWTGEMFRQPIYNVSYDDASQYAYCYRSPFARFLANSFAHNAQAIGFDGIRFDTVTPGYTCESLAHDCGWFDDAGQRHATYSFFSQRQAWKEMYRVFHGGAVKQGIIYTPNAAGPIMAVHSFSDVHEIGEGFYQKSAALKDGYPPALVRALMSGEPYGFVTQSNLKDGPLFYNQRIGALLVNGSQPRFHDHRHWSNRTAAHGCPGPAIWDAWDWVDTDASEWLGWWENQALVTLTTEERMVLASLHRNRGARRVLLVACNYEPRPVGALPVQLNLAELGLDGAAVFGEDAITGEPLAVDAEGRLRLDFFGHGYRLIKLSHERSRFDPQNLGPELLLEQPDQITDTWRAPQVSLQPGGVYVLQALVSIPTPIGQDSANPNVMGKFSPAIRHYVTLVLDRAGAGEVTGVLGATRRSGGEEPYDQNGYYRRGVDPQWWEATEGAYRLHLPVRVSAEVTAGSLVAAFTDPGSASLRQLSLRQVLAPPASPAEK